MDFEKLIADGLINTVVDEAGNKFYVWSEKVERPIIPFVEVQENPYKTIKGNYIKIKDPDRFFEGKPCRSCGSTTRYKTSQRCVACCLKLGAKKRAKAKAVAND